MNNLEEELLVGAKIRIGEKYAEHLGDHNGLKANEVIDLVEGQFEVDNGLYTFYEYAPSIKSRIDCEYESIYHLFGNDLETFMDCEVLKLNSKEKK